MLGRYVTKYVITRKSNYVVLAGRVEAVSISGYYPKTMSNIVQSSASRFRMKILCRIEARK